MPLSKPLVTVCISVVWLAQVIAEYEVIYAVNCGGPKHTDRFGIQYQADNNLEGIGSEYGKGLIISRVHPEDAILYQTERYHVTNFAYDIQIPQDGDYVLILKFSEVYFETPGGKVFDIVLNSQHTVLKDFDIFARVGKAAALDEVVPFTVQGSHLTVAGETSDFDGNLRVEFLKGAADNPKINAIVVIKTGKDLKELPALPPPQKTVEEDLPQKSGDNTEWGDQALHKFKRTSGPRVRDPYASDDSWFMPITVAVAIFLPILFCLCRVR